MGQDHYRSRKERDIAGMLRRYSLNCRHEYPLAVLDRGQLRLWYPDFLLPDQGAIIEYCGVQGSEAYNGGRLHKEEVLRQLGLPALFLEPSDLHGYWPEGILKWLEEVQVRRLDDIRTARKLKP